MHDSVALLASGHLDRARGLLLDALSAKGGAVQVPAEVGH